MVVLVECENEFVKIGYNSNSMYGKSVPYKVPMLKVYNYNKQIIVYVWKN